MQGSGPTLQMLFSFFEQGVDCHCQHVILVLKQEKVSTTKFQGYNHDAVHGSLMRIGRNGQYMEELQTFFSHGSGLNDQIWNKHPSFQTDGQTGTSTVLEI